MPGGRRPGAVRSGGTPLAASAGMPSSGALTSEELWQWL